MAKRRGDIIPELEDCPPFKQVPARENPKTHVYALEGAFRYGSRERFYIWRSGFKSILLRDREQKSAVCLGELYYSYMTEEQQRQLEPNLDVLINLLMKQ